MKSQAAQSHTKVSAHERGGRRGREQQTRLRDVADREVAAVVLGRPDEVGDLLKAAVEREAPGEHNIHDHTKRPHVARLGVRAAVEHLRRRILQRAAARLHQLAAAIQLREPKVRDDHTEVVRLFCAQDVFWLLSSRASNTQW